MSTRNRTWKWNPRTEKVEEVLPEVAPDVEAPYVQDDTIPPTVSHATDEGRVFESRSALYAHYRANGFECDGGAHNHGRGLHDYRHKSNVEDIKRDLHENLNKIKWGMAPVSEREREICLREERKYQEFRKNQSR